jgi:hypothetical protein
MRCNSRTLLAAAILFVASILGAGATQAQRAASAASSRPSAHARPIAAHMASARSSTGNRFAPVAARNLVRFNPASNNFEASDGSSVSLQELLNPIPPPGFNYQFLSVMNQDLGIKAVIDPATEWKLAVAQRVLRGRQRFGGSGFYLLDGGAAYAVPDESASVDSAPPQQSDQPAQQPQVIVVQATPPAQQTAEQPSLEDSAPLPDVGQFTLVLRNGTQLQAVAFTRMNDRIVYITAEGSRRSIAVADLNSDATVSVNEERGTPLQLPL